MLTGQKRPHPGRERGRGNNWAARRGRSRRRFHQNNNNEITTRNTLSSPVPLCSVCHRVENPKYKCPQCRETYCSIPCCRDHKARGCNTPTVTASACGSSNPQTEDSSNSTFPFSKYLPQREVIAILQKQQQPQHQQQQQQQRRQQQANTSSTADIGSSELPITTSNHDKEGYDNWDNNEQDHHEDGWKITQHMLDAMEGSEWLRTELQDVGLRHLITSIDGAADRVTRNSKTTQQERDLEQAKMDYPAFQRFIDKLLVLTGILERQPAAPGRQVSDLAEWLEQEQDHDNSLLVMNTKSRPTRIKPSVVSGDRVEEDSSSDSDDSTSSDESSDSTASSGVGTENDV